MDKVENVVIDGRGIKGRVVDVYMCRCVDEVLDLMRDKYDVEEEFFFAMKKRKELMRAAKDGVGWVVRDIGGLGIKAYVGKKRIGG